MFTFAFIASIGILGIMGINRQAGHRQKER